MDNNNMNTKYIDYPASEIQAKLQQCLDYEAKYGAIPQVLLSKNGVIAMNIARKSGNGDKM